MKLAAREAIAILIARGFSLSEVERVLEIKQRTLKQLYTEEGPAQPEMEVILNLIILYPWMLTVAQSNFNLQELVVTTLEGWKESL